MTTKIQVQQFLVDFKIKFGVFGVIFENRDKNFQTLLDLDITPKEREGYLLKLNSNDFSEGPITHNNYPNSPPLYVFGINVKGREVYIKINLGKPEKSVMCISFHISKNKMKYPFKEKGDKK